MKWVASPGSMHNTGCLGLVHWDDPEGWYGVTIIKIIADNKSWPYKIIASGPITSWQVEGETMETVTDFLFGGSNITAECYCSHEIKRHLLLGRKVMTNQDSILKNRDITLLTNVNLLKALVFPVTMYGCESWTIKKAESQKKKKAESQRIDAFELWCWGRLLRVPWSSRRSNQSILKGVHWKDWCWSWNSSTLATWCKELTHLKRPGCWRQEEKGATENEMVGWHHWLNGHKFE